jgi:hypothetical protein
MAFASSALHSAVHHTHHDEHHDPQHQGGGTAGTVKRSRLSSHSGRRKKANNKIHRATLSWEQNNGHVGAEVRLVSFGSDPEMADSCSRLSFRNRMHASLSFRIAAQLSSRMHGATYLVIVCMPAPKQRGYFERC